MIYRNSIHLLSSEDIRPKKSSNAGHGGFEESISRLQMLAFEAQAIGRAGMPTVEPVELEHAIPSGKLIWEKTTNTAM